MTKRNYVLLAAQHNLLKESYNDIVYLDYRDELSDLQIHEIITGENFSESAAAESDTPIDEYNDEELNFAVTREVDDVVEGIVALYDDDTSAINSDNVDESELRNQIRDYVWDHIDCNPIAELVRVHTTQTAETVTISTRLLNEDHLAYASDYGVAINPDDEDYLDQVASWIITQLGFDAGTHDKMIALLKEVPSNVYEVYCATTINIADAFANSDATAYVTHNPTIVIGNGYTGGVWADTFDGQTVVLPREYCAQATWLDDIYAGFTTESTAQPTTINWTLVPTANLPYISITGINTGPNPYTEQLELVHDEIVSTYARRDAIAEKGHLDPRTTRPNMSIVAFDAGAIHAIHPDQPAELICSKDNEAALAHYTIIIRPEHFTAIRPFGPHMQ